MSLDLSLGICSLCGEAVFVVFVVPVFGVLLECGALDGRLEVLEAGLAFDGLGCGVLTHIGVSVCMSQVGMREALATAVGVWCGRTDFS